MSPLSLLALSLLSFTAHAAPHASRAATGPGVVALGTAGTYAILAQSGLTSVPATSITGDIGVSPVPASYITGLGISYTAGAPSGTSSSVVGNVFAADYGTPTPANLQAAVGDANAAYLAAVALPSPDFTNLGSGAIGGLTLAPGLYYWSTGVSVGSDVTIFGSSSDTWVFQIASTLGLASGVKITLAGGALPANIFWAVGGAVTLGTTSHFEGVISSTTSVTLLTGATQNGRIFAQTNVALQQATLVAPTN